MKQFSSLKLFFRKNFNKITNQFTNINTYSHSKHIFYDRFKSLPINNLYSRKYNLYGLPNDKLFIKTTQRHFSTDDNINKSLNKKEKEIKANYKEIKNVIFPLFTSKPVKRFLIYSLFLTIGSKLLITTSPYFLKLGINSIIDKENIKYSLMFLTFFGVNRIIGSALNEYRQVTLNKVTTHVIIDFSQKMMEYLMRMEHHLFKSNSQLVLSKFEKSLRGIESINRFLIGSVLSNTIEFFVVSSMIWMCCGEKYFLNTVFIYTVYMITTRIISNSRRKIIQDRWKEEIKAESKLSDTVYNIDTVKFFQNESKEIKNYTDIVNSVREKAQLSQLSLSKLNVTQSLIISLGIISNLTMGVHDCYKGILTPGDLVMLNVIFNQVMTPLNFMGSLMREVDETRVNLSFTIEMINKRESLIKDNQMPPFIFKGGNIEFKDVVYGYTQAESGLQTKLIINKLNVCFNKGTINAIVGHSGNGKSTIFNLIYKLIEPNSGSIVVDDQNLNEIQTNSYRNYLSICPQNGYLFNTSIFNNIAYGKKDATFDEVVQMAKAVNMHNIIEKFPQQYNSNVGTLGAKLSGGEKQRILLARSFLKNSEILLLDEPTSNLDNENEMLIMDYIFKNYRNKTVLIAAHKLNTIINCDNIYVLHKGIMSESGKHKDLMSDPKTIYSEMFRNYSSE